jgi:hypothetical protein
MHPLLLEYAQQLYNQAAAHAAASAGVPAPDGMLFGIPGVADFAQQLQQQAQQLQELAAKNSIKLGAVLALADAAAAAAGGVVDLTGGAAADAGSSSSMLWTTKYAPAAVQQLCGNAAAAAAFQTFLSDWKGLIQQHAAAVAAGKPQGGGKAGAGAAESDAETGSSWMLSEKSGWGSSVCDESAAMGR